MDYFLDSEELLKVDRANLLGLSRQVCDTFVYHNWMQRKLHKLIFDILQTNPLSPVQNSAIWNAELIHEHALKLPGFGEIRLTVS